MILKCFVSLKTKVEISKGSTFECILNIPVILGKYGGGPLQTQSSVSFWKGEGREYNEIPGRDQTGNNADLTTE